MKKGIDTLNKKLFKKINLKRFGIFFLASFAFLMLSKLSETFVQQITYPIKIIDLPEDIQLQPDASLEVVTRVKSTGFRFLPLVFKKPSPIVLSAQTDLKQRDTNQFLWYVGNNYNNLKLHLPASYEIISVVRDSMLFNYETLASKTLQIKVMTDISFASGFDLYKEFNVSEDSVKVIGPQSVLDTISTISTNLVALKGVKNNFSESVELVNPDPQHLSLSPNTIVLNADVRRFTEGELVIPIEVVNQPKDIEINYFPKQVTLTYYVDLENFKDITENDFKVVIDYNEFLDNTDNTLTPKVTQVPDEIKAVRLSRDRIDFIIL